MSKAPAPESNLDSHTARPKQKIARSNGADALKHGLATDLILLSGEDGREFEEFATKIVDDLQPQGPLEQALTDEIVTLLWRLKRIPVLEAAVINARDPTEPEREASSAAEEANINHRLALAERYVPRDQTNQPNPRAAASEKAKHETEHKVESKAATDQPLGARAGRALINDSENGDALGKLLRLETALSNTLDRTMSRLFSVQSARRKRKPPTEF